jgi:hypothetical protein
MILFTKKEETKWLKESHKGHFNLELLGQVHWHLATQINQLSNFNIELDQSR